jgi:uncharacterized membrane protein HdeD (DUF308 family)
MLHWLARNWWIELVRGIAAIVFGLLAFVLPGVTLLTLVILYGAYALADGVFALIAAIRGEAGPAPRWWLAVVGALGVAAGLATFLWPGLTALILAIFIGAWSLARGVFEIVGAIRLRKEIDNEWLLILSGLLSVVFGAVVLLMPGAGALAIVWIIGAYAIALGALHVGLALRLRTHSHAPKTAAR